MVAAILVSATCARHLKSSMKEHFGRTFVGASACCFHDDIGYVLYFEDPNFLVPMPRSPALAVGVGVDRKMMQIAQLMMLVGVGEWLWSVVPVLARQDR